MRRLHEEKIDYPEYYEKLWDPETNERPFYDTVRHEALAEPVKLGDRVLDVGAGVYGTAQFIAENYGADRYELVALDYSYTAKDAVDAMGLQLEYVLGDVMDIPFPDESFDLVTAGEIIEHLEDPAAFVQEMLRVTKPGGTITLSTVDTTCEDAIAHGDYPEHLWEFTEEDLLGFFAGTDAQFSLVGDYQFIKAVKR